MRELKEIQEEFAVLTGEGKKITIGRIMIYNRFFNWKREQIEQQQQVILKATQDKQQKLKALMKIEKRLNEYNAAVLFEEQKMLDEIGLQLHIRNS